MLIEVMAYKLLTYIAEALTLLRVVRPRPRRVDTATDPVLMLLVLSVAAVSRVLIVALVMLALSAVNIEVKTDDDETVVVLIENPLITSDAIRLLVLMAFVTVKLFAVMVDVVRVEKLLTPALE